MKQLLSLAILVLFANTGSAQTTERIQINAGNFIVPQKEPINQFTQPFIRNIGISYEHKITTHMRMRVHYNRWFRVLNIGAEGGRYGGFIDGYFEPFKQAQDRRIGDVRAHYNYQSVDLIATYQLLQAKHHELYTSAGVSYTWGEYSEYTGIYNEPGYPDWLSKLETRKHQDMGLIFEIGYNYMLLKNRITIGVSETVKGYTTLPFQFYTNINIGYNFNWISKKKAVSGR